MQWWQLQREDTVVALEVNGPERDGESSHEIANEDDGFSVERTCISGIFGREELKTSNRSQRQSSHQSLALWCPFQRAPYELKEKYISQARTTIYNSMEFQLSS